MKKMRMSMSSWELTVAFMLAVLAAGFLRLLHRLARGPGSGLEGRPHAKSLTLH